MAPSTIYLHIGAPKTGTTYLQDMLWANKDVLERAGVLVPGHYPSARLPAVRDLLTWDLSSSEPLPRRWLRIANEMKRWGGQTSVLSQEFMCRMSDEQTHAVVESLGQGRVHCILTVRDISRLVTAQWQTAMRSRRLWTLTDYSAAVTNMSTGPEAESMRDHFWARHDYRAILTRWIGEVGSENVTVVTVPQSGSDPEELWRRFCHACDIEPSETASAEPTHESLGATSAELMRKLNAHEAIDAMKRETYQQSVNTAISRRGLIERRRKEPKLVLPPEYAEWAVRTAEETVTNITGLGVRVVGDLDDLLPRPAAEAPIVPEEIPAHDLLDASIDALAGLVVEHGKLSHTDEPGRRVPGGRTGHTDSEGVGTIRRLRAAWRRRAPLR